MQSTDYCSEANTRIEQLEHQRMMDNHRKQIANRKLDTRRYIIIGKIICRHFPILRKYTPKPCKDETDAEFADVDKRIAMLAENCDWLFNSERPFSVVSPED